jgi:hypothetical protein
VKQLSALGIIGGAALLIAAPFSHLTGEVLVAGLATVAVVALQRLMRPTLAGIDHGAAQVSQYG